MLENSIFINLDFFPPTSERLCRIPDAAAAIKNTSIYVRLIDNFPWSFDIRMKSDTAFDDTAVSYFSRKCAENKMKLIFIFPGIFDYCRILRLKGYNRFASFNDGFIKINTEAFGFSSFIEQLAEDIIELCPEVNGFCLCSGESENIAIAEALKEKSEERWDIYESVDCYKNEFLIAENLLEDEDHSLQAAHSDLKLKAKEFYEKRYFLNQLSIMSSIGSNYPASYGRSLYALYKEVELFFHLAIEAVESIRKKAEGKIEENWLNAFCRSSVLTIEEDFLSCRNKLKQAGVLN